MLLRLAVWVRILSGKHRNRTCFALGPLGDLDCGLGFEKDRSLPTRKRHFVLTLVGCCVFVNVY